MEKKLEQIKTHYLYAVQEYNKDVWDPKHSGPLSREEALKFIKDLRRWAKEDESGKRYRMIKVYLQ